MTFPRRGSVSVRGRPEEALGDLVRGEYKLGDLELVCEGSKRDYNGFKGLQGTKMGVWRDRETSRRPLPLLPGYFVRWLH